MEKETKRGNGIQEAKSSILFISTRISGSADKTQTLFLYLGIPGGMFTGPGFFRTTT